MRRAVVLAVLLGVVGGAWATLARSEELSLAELRQRLIDANSPHAVTEILDRVSRKIGDSLKLAEWLGSLPEPARSRPYVLLRRGWALVSMGKGAQARPLFERVVERGVSERQVLGLRRAVTGAGRVELLTALGFGEVEHVRDQRIDRHRRVAATCNPVGERHHTAADVQHP